MCIKCKNILLLYCGVPSHENNRNSTRNPADSGGILAEFRRNCPEFKKKHGLLEEFCRNSAGIFVIKLSR